MGEITVITQPLNGMIIQRYATEGSSYGRVPTTRGPGPLDFHCQPWAAPLIEGAFVGRWRQLQSATWSASIALASRFQPFFFCAGESRWIYCFYFCVLFHGWVHICILCRNLCVCVFICYIHMIYMLSFAIDWHIIRRCKSSKSAFFLRSNCCRFILWCTMIASFIENFPACICSNDLIDDGC